jgi:hypothetical protein
MYGNFMVKVGRNFLLPNLKFNVSVKVVLRLTREQVETRALEFRLSA